MENKNHMAEVAKMFGLKLNEPFIIKDLHKDNARKYEFRETGLCCLEKPTNPSDLYPLKYLVQRLLVGSESVEIVKLPWKPRRGQEYYIPSIDDGRIDYGGCTWSDSRKDDKRYENGLVCRTEDEATELAKQLLEVARRRYDD